ncbi:MAG: DUF1549 and DUF1553 domain-containing protein [Pirellulaceae bacterium]|nr:DUF1549 and DUF1553 domain-containing protein [Pirellulaceae bacterium]
MTRPLLVLLIVVLARPCVAPAEEPRFHDGDWPFVPVRRPDLPAVPPNTTSSGPIDQFILAELAQHDLSPNQPAELATQLRRVTLDLTGLPPTPDEIEALLADQSPDAYERAVDRLLASPRFGERWARHWLDVVRYADTAGYKIDWLRKEAYRYRDYVVRAMNSGLPYDQFIREQLAGDELPTPSGEAIVATGLLRMYPQESTAADFLKQRQDVLDDLTEVTGLAFMGLTLGCARCHDHKFDPIQQADFFRLQACFAGIVPRDDIPAASSADFAAHQRQQAAWEAATAEVRAKLDALTASTRNGAIDEITLAYDPATRAAWRTPAEQRTIEQRQLMALSFRYVNNIIERRIARLEGTAKTEYDLLQTELAEFDHLKPAPLPLAMSVGNGPGAPAATRILETGDYRHPAEIVQPGFPAFLGGSALAVGKADSPVGRRTALADWLTRPDHPLTARVIVNRLWQHHFGRGILPTANDFGLMGETATHPELLDWLAAELPARRWDLKTLHRQMVTSEVYRQSSRVDPSNPAHVRALQIDSGNQWLWHRRRVRLEGEIVRDSLLSLSGRLNLAMFGPASYPALPAALVENTSIAWQPDPQLAGRYRRTVYCIQKRNLRQPLLAAFDQPDMYASCGVRTITLTPVQALALLNGEEAAEEARHWAGRLLADCGGDAPRLVQQAWLAAYGRVPTAAELTDSVAFLQNQAALIQAESAIPSRSLPEPLPASISPAQGAACVDWCHALMNSSEFLFVD